MCVVFSSTGYEPGSSLVTINSLPAYQDTPFAPSPYHLSISTTSCHDHGQPYQSTTRHQETFWSVELPKVVSGCQVHHQVS